MTTFQGIEVLDTLEERVTPRHTALLVVDMQNDYCSPGGASDRNGRDLAGIAATISPTRHLIEAARAANVPVIFAKYTVGPGTTGLSGPEIMRRGAIFAGVDATIKGTWGHDIVEGLPYRPDEDVVIEKRRLSAFVATELDHLLHGWGTKTLVISGVVTQGCIETTVRDAACYDYYVAVAEDCVASSSAELHQAGLKSLSSFLRYEEGVTSSERIMGIWDVAARSK